MYGVNGWEIARAKGVMCGVLCLRVDLFVLKSRVWGHEYGFANRDLIDCKLMVGELKYRKKNKETR